MDNPGAPRASSSAVVLQLEALWQQGERPDPDALMKAAAISSAREVAEVLAADQWQRWHSGERISVEDYFARHPGVAADAAAALLLVYGEFLVREECGETPSADEYVARFPQCAEGLRLQLDFHVAVEKPSPTSSALGDPLPTNRAPLADEPAAHDELFAFLAPGREPGSLGRLDHYEVLQVVGRGGVGVVFKARDTKLKRVVAIKVLAPQFAPNATALKRFVREAQAAAAVRDDHVVSIHAISDEGEVPYLAMEFIRGQTLEQRIKQGVPMDVKEILRIGMQAAEGLAAAHRQGLIHRDVKPANILLENGVQRVKITDFGMARAVDEVKLTQSGVIGGTPLFMSPEQARGESLDPRSDLFSLGSVLYTLCTGRAAFAAGNTMAVLKRVCEATPRPICEVNPDVPEWLAVVVNRLLAKEPAERFQSAAELAEVLRQQLAQVQQSPLPPAPAPERLEAPPPAAAPAEPLARKRKRLVLTARKRLVLAAGLLGPVGFAAGLATIMALSRPSEPDTPPPGPGTLQNKHPLPSDDPGVLTVSQKPEDGGRFRTIQEALDKVKPGMTIRVLDDVIYDEYLLIDQPEHRGVTLEATGKASLRRLPRNRATIWIRDVPGLTLRGFRIVGTRKKDDFREVYITGSCPGMVLDRLDMKCGSDGVVVYDVPLSSKDTPIVIQNCTISAGDEAGAVVIKGRPHEDVEKKHRPQPCGHVVIRNNDMVRCNQGVELAGAVHKVHVVGNRFRESKRRAVDLDDLLEGTADVLIANNTMYRCESAVAIWDDHTMGKDFLKCKNIRVQNNLVFQTDFDADMVLTNRLRGDRNAQAREGDLIGLRNSPEWRFTHNWREVDEQRGSKVPGRWIPYSRTDQRLKQGMVMSRNSSDPNFLRPAKDSPLAKGGAGVSDPALPAYVGALPPEGVEPWDWDKTWSTLSR